MQLAGKLTLATSIPIYVKLRSAARESPVQQNSNGAYVNSIGGGFGGFVSAHAATNSLATRISTFS